MSLCGIRIHDLEGHERMLCLTKMSLEASRAAEADCDDDQDRRDAFRV